ncbi:MAG: membrane protein insertion efficiency factor YidD [Acidobacteriota bacterium]
MPLPERELTTEVRRQKRFLEFPSRGRLFAWILLLALFVDWARPAERQVSVHLLTGGISFYQQFLSPVVSRLGTRCRFHPTCSRYGEMAIHQHGALLGTAMTARRLVRCGPWTPMGTRDFP